MLPPSVQGRMLRTAKPGASHPDKTARCARRLPSPSVERGRGWGDDVQIPKKFLTPARKPLISKVSIFCPPWTDHGTGVHITSSIRGAPVASITTRSNPIAIPAAGGMIDSAARKSSSSG